MVLSSDDPRNPPFPKEQANKIIRKFLGSAYFSSDYRLGFARPHFQQRLLERGLTINDAKQIIQTGVIYDEPEYSQKFGEWRYAIEGDLISKRGRGRLVFTFRSETEIQCVTIVSGIKPRKAGRNR